MRCLYLVAHDPISPNYVGGASAIYYDQLLALSELGHEICLWHYCSDETRQRFNRFVGGEPVIWETVKTRCRAVRVSTCANGETVLGRGMARVRSLMPPRLPVPRWSLYREQQRILQELRPDFIWAQHFEPALLAAQQSRVPVVYSHHDWLYRIKALRNHREIRPRQRAVEERLVRSVSAVVSGSKPECEEISRAGCQNIHYIPVTFEKTPLDLSRVADAMPRLVHLGGMGTTANREGLLAFFNLVWPQIKNLGLTLEVVGDTAAAPAALKEHLRSVKCTGFVKDLTTVLRPLDLHVIPWDQATGQRTRLPLAFNYGQVVVATKAAVACYPEARDGENCRLVNNLAEMASVIPRLAADRSERLRLAAAARRTFESCFTRQALLPKYAAVIQSLDLAKGKGLRGKGMCEKPSLGSTGDSPVPSGDSPRGIRSKPDAVIPVPGIPRGEPDGAGGTPSANRNGLFAPGSTAVPVGGSPFRAVGRSRPEATGAGESPAPPIFQTSS